MRTIKHLAFAAMAASALALAGCGGGGSSSTSRTTTPAAGAGSGTEAETRTPAELAATASGLLDTAETDVNAVMDDSDAATVTTAEMAVAAAEKAVMAASAADDHAALSQRLGTLQGSLTAKKRSRQTAMSEQSKMDRAAMVAAGKALYSKLNYGATMVPVTLVSGKINIGDTTTTIDGTSADSNGDGLAKQEAAAPPLTGWTGADYMRSTGSGTSKVTHNARVYSNQKAATQVLFISDSALTIHGLTRTSATNDGDAYTVVTSPEIMLDDLDTSGVKTLTAAEQAAGLSGSFMGADGTYKCPTGTCTAAPINTGGVTLAGDWTFTPGAQAMVSKRDADYLQFGWWVRKDDDDGPTHASAFYGIVGTGTTVTALTTGTTLTGTAEYTGKAAGKFAINNPLGSDSDGGHFTANAELNAKFGATEDDNTNGLMGTIDGFRLNDGTDDPGWSVELKRARWSTDRYQLTTTGDATTADDDHIIAGTAVEWSIDRVASPGQTGQWEAQLFDESPNDNSTSPTTVLGRFEAGFGGTHKMVGAFGATK